MTATRHRFTAADASCPPVAVPVPKSGPHRTRQRCSGPVSDRTSASRPVPSHQNRFRRRLAPREAVSQTGPERWSRKQGRKSADGCGENRPSLWLGQTRRAAPSRGPHTRGNFRARGNGHIAVTFRHQPAVEKAGPAQILRNIATTWRLSLAEAAVCAASCPEPASVCQRLSASVGPASVRERRVS